MTLVLNISFSQNDSFFFCVEFIYIILHLTVSFNLISIYLLFFLGAQNVMRESVSKAGGASESVLRISEDDISRNIFTMLGPIFKRHVLLAKQESAIEFNAAVGDDLAITIKIVQDLNTAKKNALTTFSKTVKKLIPKNAPKSSWNTDFDRKQLLDSLEEYIGSRVDQLKIQGVLSRGRKPVDIAFNVFLHHPLGNIYSSFIVIMYHHYYYKC